MPDYVIVDVHVHTYPSAQIGDQALMGAGTSGCSGTIGEILGRMDDLGIARSVMVNMTPMADMRGALLAKLPADLTADRWAAAEDEVRANLVARQNRRNAWSCGVVREYPQLVAFIGLDPCMTGEEMRAEIDAWLGSDLAKGIKIHPAGNRHYPNDHRLWPAYELAQELDVPILFHAGRLFGDEAPFSHPRYFGEIAESFPRLRMILGHLCFDFFDDALALAERFPNITFDCSAAVSEQRPREIIPSDRLVQLMRGIGVQRVLFGSDFPWYDPGRDIERVLSLPLADDEKRLILGENAIRVCKL